jgi:hypothetical protein
MRLKSKHGSRTKSEFTFRFMVKSVHNLHSVLNIVRMTK